MAETKIVCPHCQGLIILKPDRSARIIAEKAEPEKPTNKPDDPDDILDILKE